MAMTGQLDITGGYTVTGTGNGGSVNQDAFVVGRSAWDAISLRLTDGTADNQGQRMYVAERTLAASANDDLDLAGSLTDGIGNTLTFAKVKLILVVIDTPDGVKKLKVGPGSASNTFTGPFLGTTPAVELYDLALFANLWAGWAVTASTADILRVTNHSAVSVTYRIFIAGY